MGDNKDYHRISVLSRNNYKIWFQNIKFKLEGKDIFYIIKVTKYEHIWIKRVTSTALVAKILTSLEGGETKVNKLTSQFKYQEVYRTKKRLRNISVIKPRHSTLLVPPLALTISLQLASMKTLRNSRYT